ncbi:hypothetical protein H6G27_36325 [Nostoc linckia FACHB-104]|nr:hypothetical protein [Nostoc linckia FACHB-104]
MRSRFWVGKKCDRGFGFDGEITSIILSVRQGHGIQRISLKLISYRCRAPTMWVVKGAMSDDKPCLRLRFLGCCGW